MDMIFPFESLMHLYREFGLVGAVVIGFFFGLVLERAGFGRATKLAAQFYFTDMTVFKVMFSAIVTAMLGLIIASSLGLADLKAISESAASATYIWPMLIGGLLLGAGFIISGYCPGTSMVAAASGNLDGLMTITGVGIGSLIFGEIFPQISEFYVSGDIGQSFLYQLLGLPPAVVAIAVVLMAIGGFVGAETVERIMARRKGVSSPESQRLPKRAVFAGFATASALSLLMLMLPTHMQQAQAKSAKQIDAAQLAKRILDEPWKLMILDIRSRDAYEKSRIPGSIHNPAETLSSYGLAYSRGVQDLILVGNADMTDVPPAALKYKGDIFILSGGFDAWDTFALKDPLRLAANATPAQREAYKFQSSIHAKMTGTITAPPPRIVMHFTPPPKKKGGGCDG
jgi:rhodanese-related sulfurtransferase/uncharacterized membrane protein YedE/YeeE